MALTLMPETTIGTLLKDYPFLLDFLPATTPSSRSSQTPCCGAPWPAPRRSKRPPP